MMTATHVVLARQASSPLAPDDFVLREQPLDELVEGSIRVENRWISVDPYMRLSLTGLAGIHGALPIGETLIGAAVGEVVESAAPAVSVGSMVLARRRGWRDRWVGPATDAVVVDPALGPVQRWLGVYGLTGITAWGGMMVEIDPQPGEAIFVSGGAGAVGSVAVQLAVAQGARVIASAGSAEKGAWLVDELGAEAFINYRTDDVGASLASFAPDGIDGFFDNVGGPQLEAAIEACRKQGRIALCGAIAQYEDDNYRAGPANMFAVIEKCLILKGFNASKYADRSHEIVSDLSRRIKAGELEWRETVVDGLDNAADAFLNMLGGANIGKMVVRLG